jgi:hypothetical protein
MEAELQIAVMIKPYVKMSRMSNQWKAEIGSDIFYVKNLGRSWWYTGLKHIHKNVTNPMPIAQKANIEICIKANNSK